MLASLNAPKLNFSRKTIVIAGLTMLSTAVPAIAAMIGLPDVAIATGGVKWACVGGAVLFMMGVATFDPLAATMGLVVGSQNC